MCFCLFTKCVVLAYVCINCVCIFSWSSPYSQNRNEITIIWCKTQNQHSKIVQILEWMSSILHYFIWSAICRLLLTKVIGKGKLIDKNIPANQMKFIRDELFFDFIHSHNIMYYFCLIVCRHFPNPCEGRHTSRYTLLGLCCEKNDKEKQKNES